MDLLHGIKAFLRYRLKAKGPHGIHSPFIFGLIYEVLRNKEVHTKFKSIEQLRAALLRNNDSITVTDFGAGSKVLAQPSRKIKHIANSALSPKKYCILLYHLSVYCKANTILELGTSLGISTAYLSLASDQVVTIEGDEQTAVTARQNWENLGLNNIRLMKGEFENVLKLPECRQSFDLVFIDGHHQKEATLSYLDRIKPLLAAESVIVMDDINWSPEMQEAWLIAQSDPTFCFSVDLFRMGLLFKRSGAEKQHFVLRF